MIINGKEVIIDKAEVKKAVRIQDLVDKVEMMPDEAKRQVSKEEIGHFGSGSLESFNNTMFDQLDYDSNLSSRKERYGTYNEMAKMDFIHKALEIVADDGTQKNGEGNVIDIYSDDDRIKSRLEDLFLNRLDINNGIWSVIYDTCKLGDNFYEIVVDSMDKPKKIMDLKYLEAHQVERIEINDKLAFFTYKTEKHQQNLGNSAGMIGGSSTKSTMEVTYKLQPWQVLHFRLDDKESLPYGGSVLRAGVRTFNRIVLLEDISLVYRIARAPERRVFYIDVGNLNGIEAQRFLKKVKDSYRTQSFIDEQGKINKKANALSITQDIFIPVREGSSGTRIDTLQGGTALGGQDDLLKYFKDKIVRMLNIPPAYLGDETDKSRGCLSGDTLIKLADGRNLSMKELTKEHQEGKQNFVYSINSNNEWVIKPIACAGITNTNVNTMKVHLDNEEFVEATPDHLFMLRDGTYKRADKLTVGQSLMPIYSKITTEKDKVVGYEKILNNNTGEWEYTHKISSNNLEESSIKHPVIQYKTHNRAHKIVINHKVSRIEAGLVCEAVYDLTIDKETPNFASTAGIVIHNSLAQLDIKFSRFIERIQQQMTAVLNKVASLDLYFAGFKREDLYNFSIEFTPPSNIQEITEIEIANQRLQQVQAMISLNIFPTNYILKKVLKMTDKEIANLQLYKKLEMQSQAAMAQPADAGMGAMPPDAGMGAMPPDMGVPPEGGAPPEGMPPPEGVAPPPPAESSLVTVLGKEFLVENQKDYFKILKYIELNEEIKLDKSNVPFIFENMARRARNEKVKKNSENIEHLRIINEFGGIDFSANEVHYFKQTSKNRKGELLFEDWSVKI